MPAPLWAPKLWCPGALVCAILLLTSGPLHILLWNNNPSHSSHVSSFPPSWGGNLPFLAPFNVCPFVPGCEFELIFYEGQYPMFFSVAHKWHSTQIHSTDDGMGGREHIVCTWQGYPQHPGFPAHALQLVLKLAPPLGVHGTVRMRQHRDRKHKLQCQAWVQILTLPLGSRLWP